MKQTVEFLVAVDVKYINPQDRDDAIAAARAKFGRVAEISRDWSIVTPTVFQLSAEQSQALRNVTRTGKEAVLAPWTTEDVGETRRRILDGSEAPYFVADSAKQNA